MLGMILLLVLACFCITSEYEFKCSFLTAEEDGRRSYYAFSQKESYLVLQKQKKETELFEDTHARIHQPKGIRSIITCGFDGSGIAVLVSVEENEMFMYERHVFNIKAEGVQSQGILFKSRCQVVVFTDQAGKLLFMGADEKTGAPIVWDEKGMVESQIIKPSRPLVLANNNQSAFVDLDGDCIPDLFLTCKEGDSVFGEVFLNGNGGFKHIPSQRIALPGETKAITFADIAGRGSLDLVVGYNKNGYGMVRIYTNQQREIEVGMIKDTRNGEKTKPCTADTVYGFREIDGAYKDIKLEDILGGGKWEICDGPFISALDILKQGLPGLAIPVNVDQKCHFVFIERTTSGGFSKSPSLEWLTDIKDAVHLVLYDFKHDGETSVLVTQRLGDRFKQSTHQIESGDNLGFQVGIMSKKGSMAVLGHCSGTCVYAIEINGRKTSFYGIVHGAQTMSFSNANAMQYVGIGTARSFIEKFQAKVSNKNVAEYGHSGGIIPNTRVVLYDNGMELEPLLVPNKSPYYPYVVASVFCASFLFLCVSMAFYVQELQEDKQERRKAAHILNYDAL
eukprot:GHVN01086344.1.p1 GENE.GHVN01086344.1~~GHVN01086344.1.p1  ORF type:complete len:564 (-),score=56.74 GHVN01086344.1:2631-4322(-)